MSALLDAIVSNPGTITGSIGVILRGNNLSELLQKIGIRFETVKSGAYKDILSPDRALSTEERALLQSLIDSSYDQFVTAVAEGRNLEQTKVRSFADDGCSVVPWPRISASWMSWAMRRPREGWRHAWPISMRNAASR